MRNIVDVIEYLEVRNEKEAVLMFVDAEKVFDNVSWHFMKENLKTLGMGEMFLRGIDTIYSNQRAKLIINNNLSDNLEISKGTRKGCPLSPLLFITDLDVLNKNLRGSPEIKGVKVGVKEFKIRAFAVDLALTLEDPKHSLKEALKKIEDFGKMSGFKLNKDKTKMLVKNMSKEDIEELQATSGIMVVKKVKYLGIWLISKNVNLFKDNYENVWKEIKKDLDTWSRLKLSFLGRISVIKMNILPRMLFLFQTIPVIKGTAQLRDWQKILSKFV